MIVYTTLYLYFKLIADRKTKEKGEKK